ncbi:DUF397 domain-containing protein [Spirillospora sp. NPDC047418]
MRGSDLSDACWRKSSHSSSQTQECVEVASTWRKSSYSGSQASSCIEMTQAARVVAVRDSKDPEGPVLTFAARTWRDFLTTLRDRHSSL